MPITLEHPLMTSDFDDDFAEPVPEYDRNFVSDDELAAYFLDPEATAETREAQEMTQIEPELLEAWFQSLPPDRRKGLEDERASYEEAEANYSAVHEKLTTELPELYEAKLPPELETKLADRDYAVGFNQTLVHTAEEATAYLDGMQGVDFTNYDLTHRFLMYDQSMRDSLGPDNPTGIAGAIDHGYFGDPRLGRFVAAFPEAHPHEVVSARLSHAVNIAPEEVLPADAVVRVDKKAVYSNKYIAGFIDNDGTFWANQNFAKSNEIRLAPYQRGADSEDFL